MSKSTQKLKVRQSGAATVESAIIMVVFLMLIMGIMEFALLIFNVASLVEATRYGARYLTVNTPLQPDPKSYSCAELSSDPPPVFKCSDDNECNTLLNNMQNMVTTPITKDNIEVRYTCSTSGYAEAPYHIYDVELRLVGVQYKFITPGILGLDATINLPDFRTTRLSEDMETPP